MRRFKHRLNHYKLLTGKMGLIYPVGTMEVLPGDTFSHRASALVRLAPMAAPIMHPVNVTLYHFYVPNRLVWPEWEDFITGGKDNDNDSTVPQVVPNAGHSTLTDYMGVPPGAFFSVSALPLRGYNLIWNEYFRDQDLQEEVGEDQEQVLRANWRKDYFTASRPWEQKGPDVTLPLGTLKIDTWYDPSNPNYSSRIQIGEEGDEYPGVFQSSGGEIPPGGSIRRAILTGDAEAIDINELRKAFALQRFAEARAQYGSRYTEYLRYLGVRASDGRLDRPEYLGGGTVRLSTSEVLQTAPEGNDPGSREYGVGDMFGHGIGAASSRRYRRFFEEHGYVHSLLCVRPTPMYATATHRSWLRKDKEDFWQKELQHIGQQRVSSYEVYHQGNSDETFGYQDRYSEYRFQPSQIAGEFREDLNYWHMARDFQSEPVLNSNFIECEPSGRIFNVQGPDHLWMMVQHQCIARRLVSKTAVGRIQ